MPDLMRRTRMGKLDFARLMKVGRSANDAEGKENRGRSLARKLATWMQDAVGGRGSGRKSSHGNLGQYVKLISRLPAVLKFVPGAGKLRDIKNYLYLFCYFIQPTPNNIRSMLLYAIKHYAAERARGIKVSPPEQVASVGVYHPDAPRLFESFDAYRKWYEKHRGLKLNPDSTIGLLLMRPQIVSRTRRHYDALIRAIEREGLAVIPAISTFMDNRDACRRFFVEDADAKDESEKLKPRVSQIVSLTGFSFVGGPAMNDSRAAAEFLQRLRVPLRSVVSLDLQTVESWELSRTGLNPVQTAMQVAIPEIDGATEPLIFGGVRHSADEPEPLEERCRKIARRLARWNHLHVAERRDVRLALVVFCFPPNKGNVGTAADLDVFASLWQILNGLKADGYGVALPADADRLRELLLEGNSSEFGTVGNVAYRMGVDEYLRLCPYAAEIEREWGRAPGAINSNGREILIQGVELGNLFIGIQPTFGYEGDPMRLLMAESGSPHHGFAGLYAYIESVYRADAVIHVGTHGATEFMPGKQVGLSSSCWPDRLIGSLPNIYIYSVNNPSEGTIAKRRSYAELVSYLTPPIQSAGLYKELAALKELIGAYRSCADEQERDQLYEAIEGKARAANI
jgi:magnesium chelatase subunit H